MTNAYRQRLIDGVLAETLAGLPAVMVVGPRGSGKTTTARQHARSLARLDRDDVAAPFRADPDGVLATWAEPVLLDEWQLVPEVLPAVKRAVDDSGGAGRFILTGSVRAEMIEATWAATGRVVRVEQWGMCQRELTGDPLLDSLLDRIAERGLDWIESPADPPDLRGYIELALRGGFPELALQPAAGLRHRWLASYVDQLVTRDASLIGEDRDPIKLRRYLAALAANTAGVVDHRTLYDAAGVTRATAVSYDSLLEMMFVSERLPAWHSNRLRRLVRGPKRYLVDAALCGPLVGVDELGVLRSGDLLGRILDTFVVGQLRPELAQARRRPVLYHVRRDDGGREIDLVVEWPDGRVLGIEIKATSSPRADDARHLVWLGEQLGDLYVGGVVLHTGPRVITLTRNVKAVPIASLWASPSGAN